MAQPGTDNTVYLKTLLKYYEDEVMGVAYFYGLAEHIGGAAEREKLGLLAEVERQAAAAVRPLLDKYGLVPRDEATLMALGETHVERHRHYSWTEFVAYMAARFPAYIDDFEGLERLAPDDDLPALKVLTHHEVVAIEFAHREIAGDPDSLAPLREYIDRPTA
jgi:dimethylamine/trimethylamine dehydrogenase